MCGRYLFTSDQYAEAREIAQMIRKKYGEGSWQPGEIAPGAKAPVLAVSHGAITPELFTWGYRLPHTLVINARAENVMEKPLFRASAASRRCVVPSVGFFEWDALKRKYFFTLPEEPLVYMAGLYDIWNGQTCYCIITTAANTSMREVHARMPLILSENQMRAWLEQADTVGDILRTEPPQLVKQSREAQISLW